MIGSWLDTHFSFGEKYIGIEAVFYSPDQFVLYIGLYKVKGGQAQLQKSFGAIQQDETLPKALNKDYPVVLTVLGKGLLVKEIPLDDVEVLPSRLFPNANNEEFLVQEYPIGRSNYCFVIRSGQLDELLKVIKTAGFSIATAFLGPFNLLRADDLTTSFAGRGFILKKSGDKVVFEQLDYQPVSDVDHKETTNVSRVAVETLIKKQNQPKVLSHPVLQKDAIEFRDKAHFELTAKVALCIVLGLLILNRYVGYHYATELAALEVSRSMVADESRQAQELQKELQVRKELYKITGREKTAQTSFYADQIAALITEDIRLVSLDIFPVKTNDNQPTEKEKSDKTITITGLTTESGGIDQLVKDLRQLDWVHDALIDDINEEENLLKFTVNVKLK